MLQLLCDKRRICSFVYSHLFQKLLSIQKYKVKEDEKKFIKVDQWSVITEMSYMQIYDNNYKKNLKSV